MSKSIFNVCCVLRRSFHSFAGSKPASSVTYFGVSFLQRTRGLNGRYLNPSWSQNGVIRKSVAEYCTKETEKPLTLFQKFKALYKDYWYVLLPVHLVTSTGWFGGFYYLAESGVDLAALAQKCNLSDTVVEKLREGHASKTTGYLAIAYLLYKVATPLRYTVTLGGTTITINYLKKWGYIKSTKEIKKLIADKKEVYKNRKMKRHNIAPTALVQKYTEKKS